MEKVKKSEFISYMAWVFIILGGFISLILSFQLLIYTFAKPTMEFPENIADLSYMIFLNAEVCAFGFSNFINNGFNCRVWSEFAQRMGS